MSSRLTKPLHTGRSPSYTHAEFRGPFTLTLPAQEWGGGRSEGGRAPSCTHAEFRGPLALTLPA